ncbi:lysophospholipid acyltransferase family protein [Maridesulfovibrio sp.]|uniref:lysophospholipid acyltransferase family protein n=1 Tax=Maridesulfovibrio sp. TaxID=2795000 RepID=UPI002A18A6A9|nr:lysophospholipid acyltransferase family protein [Maridesulfovibrio sp.]
MNSRHGHSPEDGRTEKWDGRSMAPAFFHRIFYATIRLAGRHSAYFLLFFVVCFYCLLPKISKRPAAYISRRFGCTGGPKLFLHTFRLYWNFGTMLVDRAVLRITGRFEAYGSEEDKEKLRRLYAEYGKIILLTAHAGCWQMGISYLDFLDAPKAILMLTGKGDVDRHSFKWKTPGAEGGSGAQDITVINPSAPLGGTIEMINALNSGAVLCINADRTFGSERHTVETDFLGGKIRLPISAYKIAAGTGTPVAVVFSARTGPGRGTFRISEVMHVPHDADKGAVRGPQAFVPYAEAYARKLEEFCTDYPYQFYNFYDMWH